ncbi:MAG: hypothetical protein IJM30_04120 [Thermoguttaceae bacterium]|nr:hypothetical protein [Thermoguttaceae bacterium]
MKNELLFHTGWLSEEEEKELLEKGEKEGVKKGVDKALKRVATNMLAKRYSYDEVSECTGVPLPQIETLARSLDLA